VTDLKDAKMTLPDVHTKMREFMCQDTVIIGHGVENDLTALRLFHSKIIDTVILFPHKGASSKIVRNGKSFYMRHSLRFLTEKLLEKQIQTGDSGHSSAEDAQASIDLVHYYLEQKKANKAIFY
jgi:RNA exonuclease 1